MESVNIYLTEFGRKRLKEEDRLGPEELRRKDKSKTLDPEASSNSESSSSESEFEIGDNDYEKKEKKAMEKVRNYQVKRLKYYYAVAIFGNVNAATVVQEACDGIEYELSATR